MFGFDPDMIFRIPALLIALTIHEYAHARVAVWMGDPTPRLLGRLTLNPIAHLDPLGLLMLWLVKFGWAKPVPVNPNNFHDMRKGMLLVAFAGPGSNVLIAFISYVLLGALGQFHVLTGWIYEVLRLTYIYNLIFAAFNLIPIPPLDGSKILTSLLPGRQAYIFEKIEPYSPFLLIALIYLGVVDLFTRPLISLIAFFIGHLANIFI